MVRETKLKETATRKKLDRILKNLGWIIDEEDPNCNVTTENPKTKEQQKKLNRKEGDYFLYKSGTDEIIAILESKRPDESIKEALNQGIELYAKPLNVNIVIASDGTITETFHIKDNSELKKDGESITELLSEKELLKFINTSEIESPKEVKYTKQELIKVFERANNFLRKEGLREGIERFTEFANLLFLKLISELEIDREENKEKRILAKKYCWESFSDLDGERMLEYINNTILPHLVNRYNHSGDVFETKLKITNPKTLKKIVVDLDKLKLINVDSDIKGDAFEYFLKNSVTVGNDLGEYFTPRHIVRLMVKLVDPTFGDTVYDPACGTGGFLIEAFHHIRKKCKPSKENISFLKNKTVYGRELTGTAKISKMNMIITGDGHTNIKQMDSLKKPIKDKFDVVLTNFPFSQQTDYGKLYGFNTEDANPIFIKHVIDSLKKGGKAGIITFQGVLYDKNKVYQKIRRHILENCEVEAIIKLHNYVFQPYTSVNTSIIILKKGKPTKKVWFYLVNEDGFEKTTSKKGRRPIKNNDLKLLQEIWENKEETENSWSIDIEEIKNNEYSLNAETYKPQKTLKSKYGLKQLKDIIWVKNIRGEPKRLPYIEIGDIDLISKNYFYKEKPSVKGCKKANRGDIIISNVRPTRGAISYIKENQVEVSSAFTIIKSKNESLMINKLLYYLLAFNNKFLEHLGKYQQGSTYPIVKERDVLKFQIPLLYKETQEYLLDLFERKKNLIESSSFTIYNLKHDIFSPELFKGDCSSYKIKDLLKDNSIQNGLYKSKSYYGSGIPIIRINNFYNGKIKTENIRKIKLSDKEIKLYILDKGDILLNRVNSEPFVGKCCVYEGKPAQCVFESNIMRIKIDESKILPEYLVFYLSSEDGRRQIIKKIKRAVNQVSVNQEDIKSIEVPLPNLSEQQRIIDEINDKIVIIDNLRLIKEKSKLEIESNIDRLYN